MYRVFLLFSFTIFLAKEVACRKHSGIDALTKAQTLFLDNVERDIEKVEKLIESGKFQPALTSDTHAYGNNSPPKKKIPKHFTGKPKGFTNRQYAGTIHDSKNRIGGMCASRLHLGLMYYVNSGPDSEEESDNSIHVIDTRRYAAYVTTIILKDIISVDWEDMACGPCDSEGSGHCIYIGDIGDKGPLNVIYKILEPEDVVPEKKIVVEPDDVEVIAYETKIENSNTIMVSPSARIFIMACHRRNFQNRLYEIVDGKTKYLSVVRMPETRCPKGADISVDGTGFLIRSDSMVFYWYVEKEGDMKRVLSDKKQRMKLLYMEEYYGSSIAWQIDGGAYFTASKGLNQPLYRYDRTG